MAKKYNPEKSDSNLKKFTEINLSYRNLLKKISSPEKINNNGNEIVDPIESLIEIEQRQKKELRKTLLNPVIFIIFFLLAISLLILMWNIHPILGLLGLIIFVWMINNKWKTGYYFGE